MKSREASDKSIGFRLQKMRVIALVLDILEQNPNAYVYSAVEHLEDVFVGEDTSSNSKETFEEDKHYDPEGSFSLNTPVVRKSITSFIDIWFKKGNAVDKCIYFNFYSTNQIGKENNTKLTKELGLNLPEKPILEYLCSNDFSEERVLPCVKLFVINQYEEEYKNSSDENYLQEIKKWNDSDWETFLKQINWSFDQKQVDEYKKTVLQKIRYSKFFSESLSDGKEEQIFALLMEEIDARQNLPNPLAKFVHKETFQLKFLEAASAPTVILESDSVAEMWQTIQTPEDKRTVEEKLCQVCPKLSTEAIKLLNLKTTRSKIETRTYQSNPDYQSMRYRVYEKCKSLLLAIFNDFNDSVASEKVLLNWIDSLKNGCLGQIQGLNQQYKYVKFNEDMIEGIILDLFDNCFLSMAYGGTGR